MAVEVEASAPGERTRPGDILIPGWRNGRPLAVDFAIVAEPCASAPDRIAIQKKLRYQDTINQVGWEFQPVVSDVYGAVRGGMNVLQAISKKYAERKGPGYPSPSTLFWRGVSTSVWRRAGGAIASGWAKGAIPPINTTTQSTLPHPSPRAGTTIEQPLSPSSTLTSIPLQTEAGTFNAQPLPSAAMEH